MLRLLSFWLLIAAGVSSLGLMVVLMPLANALLTGAPLPGGYAELLLYWVLACGTLWLLRLGAGCLIGRRDERLRQALARGEAVQFNAHPGSFLLLASVLALCALITNLGLSRGHTGTVLVGLAVCAVLVMGLWQLLWQIAQPGSILQMDHRAINHAKFGPIPWESVRSIHLESRRHRYGQSHHLCLDVKHAERFNRRARTVKRLWRLMFAGDKPVEVIGTLRLPLSTVDADPQLVLQAARHWHANVRPAPLQPPPPELMTLVESLPDHPSAAQLSMLDQAVAAHLHTEPADMNGLAQHLEQARLHWQKRQRQARLLGAIGAGLLLLHLLWQLL